MGIESGSSLIPEDNSSDKEEPAKQAGGEWSAYEEAMERRREREKKKKGEEAAWLSYVSERDRQRTEEEVVKLSPDEREKAEAQDERTQEQLANVKAWAQGDNPNTKKEETARKIERAKQEMDARLENNLRTIKEQEYNKLVKWLEESHLSENEKKRQKKELRKQFGLE